jgi:hypothetical protein
MPIANIGAVPDVATATAIASDWGNATGSSSRGRVVHRFNTPTERDASITAPVAGMVCYVLSANQFYGYRSPGGWTQILGGPRDTTHAKMGRAATQAFPAGGGPVAFDTVLFDPLPMYSTGAGGFVVPTAGVYLVTGSLQLGVMAGGSYAQMQAIQNASVLYGATLNQVASSAGLGPSVSITMKCAAGDVVKIGVNTSVAVSSLGGTQFCWGALDYLGTG